METFITPSLAPARDSASFLEWIGGNLYTRGTPDFDKIERAAKETEDLFTGEKRLSGDPFHTHCFSAAVIGIECGNVQDPDTLTTIICHDNREYVEEQEDRGKTSPLFKLWRAGTGFVEERYGYRVEQLLSANTPPRVNHSRSSAEAHAMFYGRFDVFRDDIAWFQVRGADRVHNMWTLLPEMGTEKIREKKWEVQRFYIPLADHHGIYVPELNHGIWMANRIIQPALV